MNRNLRHIELGQKIRSRLIRTQFEPIHEWFTIMNEFFSKAP